MLVNASGLTDSVPKSRGCCKSALKLVPTSMYCGCTGSCATARRFSLCIFARIVNLFLQVRPALPDLLARGADFFRGGFLHFICLRVFLVGGDKPQNAVRSRGRNRVHRQQPPVRHYQLIKLHVHCANGGEICIHRIESAHSFWGRHRWPISCRSPQCRPESAAYQRHRRAQWFCHGWVVLRTGCAPRNQARL